MKLNKDTVFRIPNAASIPQYDGPTSSRHCITAVLVFVADVNHLRDFRVSLNFQTGGGTPTDVTGQYMIGYNQANGLAAWHSQNLGGTIQSIPSTLSWTDGRYDIYFMLTLCQTPDSTYSRFRLGEQGSAASPLSQGHRISTTAAQGGQQLDLIISATSSIGPFTDSTFGGIAHHRVFLSQLRVYEGGMMGIAIHSSLTMGGCMFASGFVKNSDFSIMGYCLQCQSGRYFDPTSMACTMMSGNSAYNGCRQTSMTSKCTMCGEISNSYNLIGPICTSSCPAGAPAGNDREGLQFCNQNPPSSVGCNSEFYSPTSCACAVSGCTDCEKSQCSACTSMAIADTTITCGSVSSSFGKDTNFPDVYQQCQVPDCQDCSGDYTQCFKCDPVSTRCRSVCDPGCIACPPAATDPKECSGGCKPGYDLSGTYCIKCLETPGYSKVNGNCLKCGTNCSACSSVDGQTCTSCLAGSALDPTANTCGQCRDGFYTDRSNPTDLKCVACEANCATCQGPGVCTTCKANLFKYANASCDSCTEAGFMQSGADCLACHSSCLTCSGPLDSNCLTCSAIRLMTAGKKCIPRQAITLVKSSFSSDLKQVSFTFDKPVKSASASIMSISEMMVYNNPKDQVITAVSANSQPLSSITSLTPTVGVNILSAVVKDTVLVVKIDASSTVKDATFIIKFNTTPALIGQDNPDSFVNADYLAQDNLRVIVTELDKGLESSKGAVSSTVASVSLVLFLISIPQAFILMKLFQTIDFYIYIDCDFPSNFSKFLEILSQGIMDMMPNFFSAWADEDGLAVYPRFEQFGLNVHVFANLGRHFSLMIILGGIKLLLVGLKFAFRKSKHSKHFSSRMA